MLKRRLVAVFILLAGFAIGYFVYSSEARLSGDSKLPLASSFSKFPFKLGLDLYGGSHLVYQADTSALKSDEIKDAMDSLRDVIERRVNVFGVAEPIVQVESKGIQNGDQRLIIELPGVTDVKQAIAMIGQTPTLEFKTERPEGKQKDAIRAAIVKAQESLKNSPNITPEQLIAKEPLLREDPEYISTPLTGRFLERATLQFDQTTGVPSVSLQFNKEGSDLFAQITKDNVNKTVAIYLDGQPISTPVVREEIKGGKAEISGNFTPQEAKQLVGRLNSGALPIPISLLSTETISAPLGQKALADGVKAGLVGLLAVAIFLLAWYRLPGFIAVLALGVYVVIMLAAFKLFGITLTAAGIAGFILSVGMAVDANILIAERTKEELRAGKTVNDAIREGFIRAWSSIRDSNISSIITGIMLFWFGTSLIKGFALVFVLGVFVSMFSAITVTRSFLMALGVEKGGSFTRFIFSSGVSKG
jgi:protein-export membrane protein SecD